jgi:hypothetical protein
LAGGARGAGGGVLSGEGPTLGDVPVVTRPPSQRQQNVAAFAEQSRLATEKGKEVMRGQGGEAGRSGEGGMWRGRGLMEGLGRGANRGANDSGWQTREQKQAFLTNYFQAGQGPTGRTTPWGDREEGEDGVPPLLLAADTQAPGHAR